MIKPILSIIIVSYNTENLLKDCLKSIFKNDKRLDFTGKDINPKDEEKIPAEIIVVDNGSTDGSRKYLKKLQNENCKIIFNRKNLGFGQANNQGMKMARGEYILLLNSDTIIPEAAISQTLIWLSSRPEYDLVGCKLLNKDKSLQLSAGRFPFLRKVFLTLFFDHFNQDKAVMYSPNKISEVDWVMGAFMLLRKEVFRKTSGFDPEIFMYMEEVEWCYRQKKAGFRTGFYPNAKIIHIGRGSSKDNDKGKPIISIYRGLVYFYKKHRPGWELFILKLMLKIKALSAMFLGIILKNEYLKNTYRQALAKSK